VPSRTDHTPRPLSLAPHPPALAAPSSPPLFASTAVYPAQQHQWPRIRWQASQQLGNGLVARIDSSYDASINTLTFAVLSGIDAVNRGGDEELRARGDEGRERERPWHVVRARGHISRCGTSCNIDWLGLQHKSLNKILLSNFLKI